LSTCGTVCTPALATALQRSRTNRMNIDRGRVIIRNFLIWLEKLETPKICRMRSWAWGPQKTDVSVQVQRWRKFHCVHSKAIRQERNSYLREDQSFCPIQILYWLFKAYHSREGHLFYSVHWFKC
jgi:hypothetical protein